MTSKPEFKSLLVELATVGLLFAVKRVVDAKNLQSSKPQYVGEAKLPLKETKSNAAPAQRVVSTQNRTSQGWWTVLKRTYTAINDNRLMSEAAGVTFYLLLAVFPAIAALVSLYGLFADPRAISDHLDMISSFVPGGGMALIRDQVQHLTESNTSKLGLGAIVGFFVALWSANQGSKALFEALNVVHDEKETRGFIQLVATSMAFTFGVIIFAIVALSAIVVLPILFDFLGLKAAEDGIVHWARWPVVLVLLAFVLACLYRFGPSRNDARWRWITWGSVFAAFAWIAMSIGFSWYVEHFGSYNKTYGSLGAVIGFMTWMWLSAFLALVGAQLDATGETLAAEGRAPD